MKKYIFTESQVKKIIDNQLNEQPIEDRITIDQGSIEFLDKKGIKGAKLSDRIMTYQKMIGCEQTGHMMDCKDIMYSKYRNDFNLWKNCISNNKSIIAKMGDGVYDFLQRLFGNKPNPKEIY